MDLRTLGTLILALLRLVEFIIGVALFFLSIQFLVGSGVSVTIDGKPSIVKYNYENH